MSRMKQGFIGFLPFCIFILLFLVGMILPLSDGTRYYNYTSRIWSWTVGLITLAAVYYIIRSRTICWKEILIAVLLGAACFLAMYMDGRIQTGIGTGVRVAVVFYGADRLYDLAGLENRSMGMGLSKGLLHCVLGAALSIPLAVLNVLFFVLQEPPQLGNYLYSAVTALQPAIQEEVVFRYFLLAYGYHLMHGKVSKRGFSIYIYLLMVVPHSLIHLPDQILSDPGGAAMMLVLTCVFFGFPMALLMKRKNLQMAAGLHWFIDFVRFAAGY